MAFIEKKDPIILNVKVTSKGRNLLSQGKLNFKYFGIGDSEIDYTNVNLNITPRILRAIDKNPNIISFIGNLSNIDNYTPIVSRTSKKYLITNTAPELGFFSGNTLLTDSSHVKQPNIQVNIDNINGGNSLNLYKSGSYVNSSSEPEINDILMVKWINKRGVNTNNNSIDKPTPHLFYKITGITSGTLATNNLVVGVDRNLPNYSLVSGSSGKIAGALVYNNIPNTGITLTSGNYIYNSLNDFINNSQCNNIKFPLWNLNIVYNEEIGGVKSGNTKYFNLNTSGLTGFINYIQEQSAIYKKLGIVHYTNSSPENIYGEGFYRNTPVLNIPSLMWHKSAAPIMGLILSGDTVQKKINKLDLVYYNLVDNNGNIVGKIFNELKLFLIEDQDLLFAMSFKSNRNWTLPEFSISIGGDNSYCASGDTVPTTTTVSIVEEYGYLYNGHAVLNVNNISNIGWHVPTDTEWTTLINYLTDNGYGYGGSGSNIAKSLASTYLWTADGTSGNVGNDQGSNNGSGFNGKPGGNRSSYGIFGDVGRFVAWWSSTDYSIEGIWYRGLLNSMSNIFRDGGYILGGSSIRLMKDSTSLTDGQTGTYIGNNGTVYATICIGTQEWLSENIKETQYRDHSTIPELQDNTDWSNDTTGARCYYVL